MAHCQIIDPMQSIGLMAHPRYQPLLLGLIRPRRGQDDSDHMVSARGTGSNEAERKRQRGRGREEIKITQIT